VITLDDKWGVTVAYMLTDLRDLIFNDNTAATGNNVKSMSYRASFIARLYLRSLNALTRSFQTPTTIAQNLKFGEPGHLLRSLVQPSTRYVPRYFHSVARQSIDLAEDTIYALSTAEGRAGIAIVRISGPSCLEVS